MMVKISWYPEKVLIVDLHRLCSGRLVRGCRLQSRGRLCVTPSQQCSLRAQHQWSATGGLPESATRLVLVLPIRFQSVRVTRESAKRIELLIMTGIQVFAPQLLSSSKVFALATLLMMCDRTFVQFVGSPQFLVSGLQKAVFLQFSRLHNLEQFSIGRTLVQQIEQSPHAWIVNLRVKRGPVCWE